MARQRRCRKCRDPLPEGVVRPVREKPPTRREVERKAQREARAIALAKERDHSSVSLRGGEAVS